MEPSPLLPLAPRPVAALPVAGGSAVMLPDLIAVARGERPADLLLRGGQIVNVLTGEIYPGNLAIVGDRIAGIGDYQARTVIDLDGQYLAPGLMDAHVHLESAMVGIPQYARAVVPRGTTAVFADPHEIANVLGDEGLRYMLAAARGLPLDVHLLVPSCVPATHLETAGASLGAAAVAAWLETPGVAGLAEMMNFPGVLFRVPEVIAKLEAAAGRCIDGHAPGLRGRDLAAYLAAGIGSDHECTTREEALEKLRGGMVVMIREGTAAKNLEALLPLVTPENADRFLLCTDDRHPADLLSEGHINYLVQRAVAHGLPPALALRLATLNPARYFRCPRVGALAPGWQADLIAFADFGALRPSLVVKNGAVVARDGRLCVELPPPAAGGDVYRTMHLGELAPALLALPAGPERVRVIGVIPEQIVTQQLVETPTLRAGQIVADPGRDLLKIAVFERHHGSGGHAVGLVRGLGLRCGAIASSVAHDSHNLIVAGTDDADMIAAVQAVAAMGGGLAAVAGGQLLGSLPLPIAGLMSDEPLETVRDRLAALQRLVRERLGCPLKDPFMQLAFLALPVIPALKITDRGLVDVAKFDFVPLAAEP